MKSIALLLATFALSVMAFSQAKDDAISNKYDVGMISLSLVMPQEGDVKDLSESGLSKLKVKILQMVTNYGIGGNGYNSNFVIYPTFEILDENQMPGMETMTSVECELTLFVKQIDINKTFASYSQTVKGLSRTKEQAIKEAIAKVPVRSEDIGKFIEESKTRILTYYQQKCNDIINEADRYSKSQQYERAIATIMTIPSDISDCYNTAQEKAIDYFKAYSNQKCAEMMQGARAEFAKNNYSSALNYLRLIDPSSKCATDSRKLINEITPKVDAEEKKYWDLELKKYNDSVLLKKHTLDSIKEIALAFFNRTQPTNYITYKSLF